MSYDDRIVLHEQLIPSGKKEVMVQIIIPGQAELDCLKNYADGLRLEEDMDFSTYEMDEDMPTEADLALDKERLNYWINSEGQPWDKLIDKFAKKKNGLFPANRKLVLHRIASTETWFDESAYGFHGDELRLQQLDETTLVLDITSVTRKYDQIRQSIDPASL